MNFTRFRQLSLYAALQQWRNWLKYIVLMDWNKRRTGKDAPKPRILELLGHSVIVSFYDY